MDEVVYMVRGKTQAICQRELDRMCERLDARPVTLPNSTTGHDWVARAVPKQKAPTAESGRGPVVSG
ncbi:hypothetical protein ACFVAF_25340 [Streptomyces sp. NPDC057596]|uniref:hypothetical protein n=1 Tax=Streptomyces sp. NPDC057596 TaxID=3346178 RepID=UPI0036932448